MDSLILNSEDFMDKKSIETNMNMVVEMAKQSTLYSYHELKVATQDFHLDNKLGEGNFGVVYKVSSFFFIPCTHTIIYV
jgi:hypothetical protein